MEKHHKFSIWYVLVGFWIVLIAQNLMVGMLAIQTIPYSRFLDLLKQDRITEVAITQNRIQGKMKADDAGGGEKMFRTIRVDPEISNLLEGHGVIFRPGFAS